MGESPLVSVIIPAYKEKYLNRTIRSLLWNKRSDIEIIVVLDGAGQEVIDNHRVHVITLPEQKGMRNAINTGVRMARGKYIIKVDAHCKFGKGFDLLRPKENEVMVLRRYKLDLEKWKEYGRHVDFGKLIVHPNRAKLQGQETKRTIKGTGETLAFQGSFWCMQKSWYEKLDLLDEETFTPFGHESVEISFKTWQNGGKILVNTDTWYAHPHNIPRTHSNSYHKDMWENVYEMYKDDYKKYVLNHALY